MSRFIEDLMSEFGQTEEEIREIVQQIKDAKTDEDVEKLFDEMSSRCMLLSEDEAVRLGYKEVAT